MVLGGEKEMECRDGCSSSFDADLCIRCLYNRILDLLKEKPELAPLRVATDSKRYDGYRLFLRIEDAADQAYDRFDREQMHHILGVAQKGERG